MPRDLGVGGVEALVLDQFGQRGAGLAAQTRLFLPGLLGRDALVLLALRADGIGLGEVDVLAGTRLAAAGGTVGRSDLATTPFGGPMRPPRGCRIGSGGGAG